MESIGVAWWANAHLQPREVFFERCAAEQERIQKLNTDSKALATTTMGRHRKTIRQKHKDEVNDVA